MPTHPALQLDDVELIEDMLAQCFTTENARDVAWYNVRTFARWLAANRRGARLMDATEKDCRAFLAARSEDVAAATVVRNWSDLRAFYAAAQADISNPLQGRMSPMTRIKMPRAPKFAITHAATVDEVDKLMAMFDLRSGAGLRNATIVSLMQRSGLRVSEVAGLHLSAVNFEQRYVMLGFTKNLQPRQPSLHPETLTLLTRYLRRRGDQPGPLFVSTNRRRSGLPARAIQSMVKRHATKAAVPITPHSLRRAFVVEYMIHGGDMASLMIIGGWESEVMIVRYMGDQRAKTAQAAFDVVAQRQIASRRRLRAVS